MLLAIDIGNTNIKCGLFKGTHLKDHYTILHISDLKNYFKKQEITNVAVSSVVPGKTDQIINAITAESIPAPYIITKNSDFHLKIKYKTPETLGIDRLCSCEGAFALLNKKLSNNTYLITIDFGTATTINIVKPPSIFIGGVIAPGVRTMFDSLKNKTSQLPSLSLENYKSILGDDTRSSMASGVIQSSIGLVDKVIGYIKKLDDCNKIIVYITGGMASKIKNYLNIDFIYDEFLVLKGIRSVYKLNKN